MDKQLKKIDFEEMIQASFTEKDKQGVLEKISKIEQKSKKKPHYFQTGLAFAFSVAIILFGTTFISNHPENTKENVADSTNAESELMLPQNDKETIDVLGNDDNEDTEIEELTVGAYVEYWDPEELIGGGVENVASTSYDYSSSNYNLYVAHLRAAVITDHAFFAGNQTMYDNRYKKYRDSILFYLTKIESGEEKIEEIQQAIQLAEQAIENDVAKGDPALDELHTILHELDEYYNTKPFLDYVTTQNGVRVNLGK